MSSNIFLLHFKFETRTEMYVGVLSLGNHATDEYTQSAKMQRKSWTCLVVLFRDPLDIHFTPYSHVVPGRK